MRVRYFLVLIAIAVAFTGMASAHEGHDESEHVDTVILASTANYPDALLSSSAAAKIGSPVLLTDQGQLPQETQDALDRLEPSEVIVVGGPAVVSSDVVSGLEQDYNVTRLWGTTRYGTSVEVAEHFWVEGADEAVLVQNSIDEQNGTVLAAAKELAREGEEPIYLTPEGKVPAVVQSSLENVGVGEVTVVGTAVSEAYRNSLTEIGVSIDEEITGEDDREVQERVQNRTSQDLNASHELLAVASSGFRHQVAASNFPNTNTYMVTSEEDIDGLVSLVNDENISSVKVAGQPELAEDAAEALRNRTDAEVRLVVATAAEAVRMNANLTEDNIPSFAKAHRKQVQAWEDRRQMFADRVRQSANESLQRAQNLVDENASEEAREELMDAQTLFSAGEYVEAREAAMEAISEVRGERFERRAGDWSEVQEQIREETSDLQERVDELRELNQEFAEEMEENMTVEERLEVIDEFRNERRETVRELMEAARDSSGDIEERLRDAREDFRERTRERRNGQRFEVDIECSEQTSTELSIAGKDGYIDIDGVVGLPTPNYMPSRDVSIDTQNNQVDVTISFEERSGPGIQCVAEAEVEHRISVNPGEWSVNLEVTVSGQEEFSDSSTVMVAADDEEMNDTGEEQQMEEETNETSTSETLPSSFTLESTEDTSDTPQTFYYDGEAVDEIDIGSGSTTITFAPRAGATYSGGAEFISRPRSVFGVSDSVQGGETTSVTFNATEDFEVVQRWPGTNITKAELDVDVE